MGTELTTYQHVVENIKAIVASGIGHAYSAVNRAVVITYWNVGKRIVEQEQEGNQRAEYGTALIEVLAAELTKEFGKSFSERNLRHFRQFYLYFPDEEIWNARVPNLSWSHFRSLLRVPEEDARLWYMNEAAHENWSSRTLDRNIATQYYYRLLQAPDKEAVIRGHCPILGASRQRQPFHVEVSDLSPLEGTAKARDRKGKGNLLRSARHAKGRLT